MEHKLVHSTKYEKAILHREILVEFVAQSHTISILMSVYIVICIIIYRVRQITFSFLKCYKKNYWIFSQISFFIWKYNPSG